MPCPCSNPYASLQILSPCPTGGGGMTEQVGRHLDKDKILPHTVTNTWVCAGACQTALTATLFLPGNMSENAHNHCNEGTNTPPALSHTTLLFRAEDLTGISLTHRNCNLLHSKNATQRLNLALQRPSPKVHWETSVNESS